MDRYGKRSNTIWVLATFLVVAILAAIAFMVAMIVILVQRQDDQNSATDLPKWPSPTFSYLGDYKTAAVAADNGVCSEIGRNIMIKGGNAVDAAVASVLCIGVMDAQSAGIGGGHFMTIYNRTTKSCVIIDARETAPASANKDMFVNQTEAQANRGWPSIGIPGEIYGLRKAYELHGSGRVAWRELVMPTVNLCRYGYVISGSLGGALAQKTNDLLNESTMHDVFYNNDEKRIYRTGEVMRRPILADTLEKLANSDDPIRLFYEGELTEKFVDEFRENNVNITRDDFRNYTARIGETERPPLYASITGNLVACGPPPPSSAAITIAMLKIMAQYNITSDSLKDNVDNNVETYHRFIEAMKFAYAARENLGDMDFVPDVVDFAKNLTSDWFAQEAKSRISEQSLLNETFYYILNEPIGAAVDDHGTAHISVLDSDGNAVSVTSTTNLFFGSMKRSISTDIIWNDDMADFSTPGTYNSYDYAPSPNNFIYPGKRPQSSMTPLVFFDKETGDVKVIAGGAGGSRIISTTAYVVMRLLFFGDNVKEAIDAPRLHNQLHPFQTEAEKEFPLLYLDKLTAKGQNMTKYSDDPASSCSITTDKDRILANSDYRKAGGYPAGY